MIETDVAIAGAGFAGIGMALQLRRAGVRDFIVLERAEDVGGTWRDNTYPGCACDIPSMLYSFSFQPNASWTRIYPSQAEIWAYLRRVVERTGLTKKIRYGSGLAEATWDDAAARWRLRTTDGAAISARVLVSAMGPLNKPNVPDLPGRETFAGPAFHSSQWDDRVDLRGKRVAVIGTGASAIQFIPQIAPQVAALTVYQRTPPWVVPRRDAAVSPLRRAARRFVPLFARLERLRIYWTLEARAYAFTVKPGVLAKAESVVKHLMKKQIADERLRAKLTPDYRMGCKRILLSDDYYPALQRENVDVVTGRIASLTPDGIRTSDGTERAHDVVIYGTGFRATEVIAPVRIIGRGGRELGAAWQAGMSAYLGTSVAGFPNLFFIIGPNTGLGHNSMIFMMESQYRYVLSALRWMKAHRVRAIDVRADVQERFNERIQRRMARTVWSSGCASWYQDKHGKNTTLWPGFTFVFRALTARLRPERYVVERA